MKTSFKPIILSLFLLMVSILGHSQIVLRENLNKKETKLLLNAIKESQKNNYKKSNQLYQKLLKSQPRFAEGKMRLATNFFTLKDFAKSEKLILEISEDFPDFDPEIYYTLANVQVEMKKHLEAGQNYLLYKDKIGVPTDKTMKAESLSKNMFFIDNALKNPVPFQPQNPGAGINTEMSEYFPRLSIDGTQLFFTRNVKSPQQFIGQEDIYYSLKDSMGWGLAQPMPDINTASNEGAFTLSADGKYLVFTICDRWDTNGGCDLYSSYLKNGEWSQVVNMGKTVNSGAWDSQPTLSADGKTIIFSSNRLGTNGGSDLWISQRGKNNAWTIPTNLGKTINSKGDDESPFLHPDGKTLYFRSNGRVGMGGFDIFYSKFNDTTQIWSEPKNIGYPINTYGQDGALSVSLDGKTAWYATDMNHTTGIKQNNLDIYHFELPAEARAFPTLFVKGIVRDGISKLPLSAPIILVDLASNDTLYSLISDEKGHFISTITSGRNYACIVSKNGYSYYTYNMNLEEKTALYKPYILNIDLWPIDKSETFEPQSIILNNIFFKFASYELLATSYAEISLIVQMMTENPHINILLTGHTDNIGNDVDNLLLSENRAQAVAEAIIKKGIEAHRIKTSGAGSSQPIADNSTEEGRQKNRRTEMIISNEN